MKKEFYSRNSKVYSRFLKFIRENSHFIRERLFYSEFQKNIRDIHEMLAQKSGYSRKIEFIRENDKNIRENEALFFQVDS